MLYLTEKRAISSTTKKHQVILLKDKTQGVPEAENASWAASKPVLICLIPLILTLKLKSYILICN